MYGSSTTGRSLVTEEEEEGDFQWKLIRGTRRRSGKRIDKPGGDSPRLLPRRKERNLQSRWFHIHQWRNKSPGKRVAFPVRAVRVWNRNQEVQFKSVQFFDVSLSRRGVSNRNWNFQFVVAVNNKKNRSLLCNKGFCN